MSRPETPPIVEVEWEDITTTHRWRPDPGGCTTVRCVTAGYLTKLTAKHISVSMSLSEDGMADETTVIPRGVVSKLRYLRR